MRKNSAVVLLSTLGVFTLGLVGCNSGLDNKKDAPVTPMRERTFYADAEVQEYAKRVSS